MLISGDFKVISKRVNDETKKIYYDLGDQATFSKFQVDLSQDLEVGKTYKLEIPVEMRSGKYGLYFKSV
jgi:hypothetical protein